MGRQAADGEPGGRRSRQRICGERAPGNRTPGGPLIPGDNQGVRQAVDVGGVVRDLDMAQLAPRFRSLLDAKKTPGVWRAVMSAQAHDSHQAFAKLCRVVDGEPRIISDPPLIIPVEEFVSELDAAQISTALEAIIGSYQRTLGPDRRRLLDNYRPVHLARKVVGVGSVGTDAWISLFVDRDRGTPLLLQVKEAEASVLERFTSPSVYTNHGERVVNGQRLMQAASDIFLGWDRFAWNGGVRDYYVRQLRDWKGSADVKGMTPAGMGLWGTMCGWTLARAHARSGDRIAMRLPGEVRHFRQRHGRLLGLLRRPKRARLPSAQGGGRHRSTPRYQRGLSEHRRSDWSRRAPRPLTDRGPSRRGSGAETQHLTLHDSQMQHAEAGGITDQLESRQQGDQGAERGSKLPTGEVGAETEVGSMPECLVVVG